jgi:RHS repeat-associated protein
VAKQEPSGTTYYAYNTENLMTRIDFAGGGSSYYEYDADSKRVSQRTADGFRQFVYQGPDMLKLQLERGESEETVAHYTMGSGLEAMRRETSSFYHYNHLGTALALTGADEAVSDTYRHDAWGVLLASTGSTVNPHTYVGRERYYRMEMLAGTHYVTVTRDADQVPHTVSDFAEDLVVCDAAESINTGAADFVANLESDYSDLRVFEEDGVTPVAFGVKEFSQVSGSEVLRIAVHSDSISSTEDQSWVIMRGCQPHPTNDTWEDKASVVASDCEGYWPMGGTEDWTANSNDGTNTNGTTADGQVADATDFDGDGWYDCGTDTSLRISGDLTVMAWVRSDTNGSGHICAKGTGNDYTHMYEFRWDPDGRLRLIGGNEDGDDWGFKPATAADLVTDNTWHCCAAVIDGSGIRMYVDGVEKYNNSSVVSSRQVNDGTFYIGRRGDGWNDADGRIDEMQVYSGAKSEDWIEVYEAMTSAPGSWASVTGEQAVPEPDLYHLGFRDYAQGLGRFTTVDPLRNWPGRFLYSDNRGTRYVDPYGLESEDIRKRGFPGSPPPVTGDPDYGPGKGPPHEREMPLVPGVPDSPADPGTGVNIGDEVFEGPGQMVPPGRKGRDWCGPERDRRLREAEDEYHRRLYRSAGGGPTWCQLKARKAKIDLWYRARRLEIWSWWLFCIAHGGWTPNPDPDEVGPDWGPEWDE